MSKVKQELADLLDLVEERVPRLRELGVLAVDVGTLRIELKPLEPDDLPEEETPEERAAREEERLRESPWTDPDTFGRRTGVPGIDPRRKG